MNTLLKEGTEYYHSGTDCTYTVFDKELYSLDKEEDEWNPIDLEDMDVDDFVLTLEYYKIIAKFI